MGMFSDIQICFFAESKTFLRVTVLVLRVILMLGRS